MTSNRQLSSYLIFLPASYNAPQLNPLNPMNDTPPNLISNKSVVNISSFSAFSSSTSLINIRYENGIKNELSNLPVDPDVFALQEGCLWAG